MSTSSDPRVLLIGWDAAGWRIIDPLMDALVTPLRGVRHRQPLRGREPSQAASASTRSICNG